MSRRRPDRRWRSPGFALRRLLRLTTTDPGGYGLSVDPEIVIAIAERARASRPALGRGAALLLGPTPRSGTNYVEAIVSAHPHVATAPCGVREAPFLAAAETIRPFEQEFGRRHAETSRGLVPYEWLGYAASGFLARAAAEAGPERLILLKDPHALRLDLAEAIFPDAKRLIVLRDGRRTVDSCVRTWALRRLGRTFADICLEWALATNAALDHVARSGGAAMAIRYEDAVAAPASVARAAQGFLGLDPGLARLTDLHATPGPRPIRGARARLTGRRVRRRRISTRPGGRWIGPRNGSGPSPVSAARRRRVWRRKRRRGWAPDPRRRDWRKAGARRRRRAEAADRTTCWLDLIPSAEGGVRPWVGVRGG
jgi:protein-tyrosine sulfotransferase